MRLEQLEVFVTVVEKRSFSEAALELGLSQAGVSRAVEALEADLGGRLLKRGRFGAQPTALGERVVAHARTILHLREAMRQEVSLERERQALRGVLRIGTFSSVARQVVVPLTLELQRQHPDLAVRIVEDSFLRLEEMLHAGQVDVAFIRRRKEGQDTLILHDLWTDLGVALLPKTAEPPKPSVSWEDLATHPIIIKEGAVCLETIDAFFAHAPVPLEASYAAKNEQTVVSMTAQGLGIGLAFRLAVEPLPQTVYAASLPAPMTRTAAVAVLPTSLKIPAVSTFLSMLREGSPVRLLQRLLEEYAHNLQPSILGVSQLVQP